MKFSIGDGDPGLVAGHELSSPLDLSRFSTWIGEENETTTIHQDEDSTSQSISSNPANHHHWARVLSDWADW